ncbi:hypothetical protein [Streptomyces rubellomurinus]|uniref:Uncharacterized protein n=1 Tax=Streptomyces rubellomurinus (strain ATCC 31215) TaxID=359131 RepID=A0A0F2TKX2_STRR3|nr:hypothetical protein [Streptomyces rubellomurinus]KJS63794.1 hypothetical protein VM95_00675 [Streptomyces rubellomurinus]
MTRHIRIGISVSAVLPTLVAALVVFTALTIGGVLPWTVLPSVLLALTVQGFITFYRLGRTTTV